MKKYIEQGKNGQLTPQPSVYREAKIQEGDLFKTVINGDGSICPIHLTAEQRKLNKQS